MGKRKNVFTYWVQLCEFVIHKIVNFQPLLVYKNGSFSFFKFFLLHLCIYLCVWGAPAEVRRQFSGIDSLLLLCGFQGSNSSLRLGNSRLYLLSYHAALAQSQKALVPSDFLRHWGCSKKEQGR